MNTAPDTDSGHGLAAVRSDSTPQNSEGSPLAGRQTRGAPSAESGDVLIRCATQDDLYATSRLQVTQLDLGLFPRLGERFVRLWHSTYLTSPAGIALVAQVQRQSGPQILGFLIGTSDEAAHMGHVLRTRRRELLTAGLLALIRRPRVAVHFVRTRARRYLRRLFGRRWTRTTSTGPNPLRTTPATTRDRVCRTGGRTPPEPERTAVLAALAVTGPRRASGAGTRLTARYLELARAGGADTARLVTKAGPDSAAPFYERLGWSRDAERNSTDGVPVIAMSYRLDRSAESR